MQHRSVLVVLSLLFSCFVLNAQTFTWADDVACIIYNNCTKCHHPGGIAPNSFLTYEEVFEERGSIRLFVQDRVMPPSPAVPGDVPFVNDNLLSPEEIQTIVTWVQQGAPSGNLGNAPPVPQIPDTDEIQNPDGVLKIEPYTSQATFFDDYRCFAHETNFGEDKWITGMEVVPGNKSIVHHVIVFEDANDVVLSLDENEPLPGYTCFGGVGSFSANFIGGWVPGQSAQFAPEGMGLLIPEGTNLIIQTHYPEGSDGLIDSTKVNLQFADNPEDLRRIQVTPYINHITSLTNGPLFIPANTTRTFHAEATVFANVSLTGVLPHMHLLGTSMKCYAVPPLSTDTIEIFNIEDWDFEWQLAYNFKRPIHLPFGTKLIAEATYDNTVNNPQNPNFPPQDVAAGEATTDEMFIIFFSYLIYEAGDENLVFEETPGLSPECGIVGTSDPVRPTVRLSPNPAHSRIQVVAPGSDYTVTLYDAFGRLLMTGHALKELYTSTLKEGMYVVVVENEEYRVVEKVMVAH